MQIGAQLFLGYYLLRKSYHAFTGTNDWDAGDIWAGLRRDLWVLQVVVGRPPHPGSLGRGS
jgi:hypothetical protein